MRDEVACAEAKKNYVLASWEEEVGPLDTKCWRWLRAQDGDGYGKLKYKGDHYRAHRIAWIIAKGPIPKGLHCLHRCDNPWCIRVEHLFLGTDADNSADCVRKGRLADNRGELHGYARLTDADVANIKGLFQERWRGLTAELADRYRVTPSEISAIVLGKIRKDVEPSPNPVMPSIPGLTIKRRKGL